VDLEILLEVEVGDLGLIIHTEELGKSSVRDDAALEGWVKAVVGLHILGHKLSDLSLGALGAGCDAHERAQLRGEGLLLEECIVGATGLPSCALLWGHLLWGDLALLLGITLLLLGNLGCLLGSLHCLAHLGGELSGEGLELLGQGSKQCLGGLGGSSGNNSRSSSGGDDNLSLGWSLLLRSLGGLLCGCSNRSRGGSSSRSGLGGLLVGGHLRV